MKARFSNFLARAESALDEYWRTLTVGQSTYIGIRSQVVRQPAAANPPDVAESIKTPPENARELCT